METGVGALRSVSLFSQFTDEEVAHLFALSRVRAYRPGEFIVKEGERGTTFYYVVSGQAEVLKGKDGEHPTVLATLNPGEYFGEMALLDGSIRSASVVARTEIECLLVPEWEFMATLRNHAEMAIKVLRVLSQRLRLSNQALTE